MNEFEMQVMSMDEMKQWLLDWSFYIFNDRGYYDYPLIVGIAKNKGFHYDSKNKVFSKGGF